MCCDQVVKLQSFLFETFTGICVGDSVVKIYPKQASFLIRRSLNKHTPFLTKSRSLEGGITVLILTMPSPVIPIKKAFQKARVKQLYSDCPRVSLRAQRSWEYTEKKNNLLQPSFSGADPLITVT